MLPSVGHRIYSGALFIRDFVVNSAPFRRIAEFSELEVVSSAENLFQYAQLKGRLDFLILALGQKDEAAQVDAWIRTLRAHQPEIKVFIILDLKRSNLPKLLAEYVDAYFDRITAMGIIPSSILDELRSGNT